MNSLGAIISGIPYCGVNISKIGASRLFESSLFYQFKKLGYQTNIFLPHIPLGKIWETFQRNKAWITYMTAQAAVQKKEFGE